MKPKLLEGENNTFGKKKTLQKKESSAEGCSTNLTKERKDKKGTEKKLPVNQPPPNQCKTKKKKKTLETLHP